MATLAEYEVTYTRTDVIAKEINKKQKVNLAEVTGNHLSLWVINVMEVEDKGPYWCNVTVIEEKTTAKKELKITRKSCYLLTVCFIHLGSKCHPLIAFP